MRRLFSVALALLAFAAVRDAATAACTGKLPKNAVYYVTDRAAQQDDALFSGERGYAERRLPRISRGTLAAPVSRKTDRACASEGAFLSSLGATLGTGANRQVVVYIPGYYTTFARATSDALALQASLRVAGPTIVYSWPSKVTSRLTYVNDESNAAWSMLHFRDFLATLRKRNPGLRLSFAAHSLGSRFAVAGMNALRQSGCTNCFGRTILFAPDVDSDTLIAELHAGGLCNGSPKAKPTSAAPVTLYVSNKDLALRQSQQLHGHQRAGQAGNELILCSGVDTVDVSYFKSTDRAGHSYQVDSNVAADARAAFSGKPPNARGLKAVKRRGETYYELR